MRINIILSFSFLPILFLIPIEINIEISTDKEAYKPGQDLAGEIKIQNTCGETRTMTMFWRVFVVRYDGVVIKQIKKEKNKVTVKPSDSE